MFAEAGTSREIVVEIPDPGALSALVAAGMGCAIVPRYAVPPAAKVAFVPLDAIASMDIFVVLPADRPPSAAARAFATIAATVVNGR